MQADTFIVADLLRSGLFPPRVRCSLNGLPGMTRDQFGLPIGGRCGSAPRHVLLLDAALFRVSGVSNDSG